jgi:hypothetical protein
MAVNRLGWTPVATCRVVMVKMMSGVEDQYPDVLQNIEFGIVAAYKEHPEMSDHDAARVLQVLIDDYKGEKIGRPPRDVRLSNVERHLLDSVRRMCEWRLGRERSPVGPAGSENLAPEPTTLDVIVLCLKRVLKSVKFWNKDGGRQGYLNFVIRYVR